MQTKLKPIFLLVTLAATMLLLYTADDAKAQNQPVAIFNLPAISPGLLSISSKLGHSEKEKTGTEAPGQPTDTVMMQRTGL